MEQGTIGTITRRKLVNTSKVEYATWGVNHVQGCLHDCKYCYARSEAKAHGRILGDDGWADLALVHNAAEQIAGELDRKRSRIDRVHLCFASDPFMWDAKTGRPVTEIAQASLDIIKAINARDIPVTVLTKGVYPEIDAAVLHPHNHYGITVVLLSEEFRQEWEPGAPPVADRIAGLRRIAEQAAWTWVSIEPYPTPNLDSSAGDIVPLLEELDFIDKFIFGRLNYTPAATSYLREDPHYYDRAATAIDDWCRARSKWLHIKSGTPLHDPSTADILSACPTVKQRTVGGRG